MSNKYIGQIICNYYYNDSFQSSSAWRQVNVQKSLSLCYNLEWLSVRIRENISCHSDYEYILVSKKAQYEKARRTKLNFGFTLTQNP